MWICDALEQLLHVYIKATHMRTGNDQTAVEYGRGDRRRRWTAPTWTAPACFSLCDVVRVHSNGRLV